MGGDWGRPVFFPPQENCFLWKISDVYKRQAESIEDISDYTLTITGKSTQEEAVARLDSTAAYGVGVNSWGDEEQMVVVTITNNTQETVYDCQVAFALYDAEGKLCLLYTSPSAQLIPPPAPGRRCILGVMARCRYGRKTLLRYVPRLRCRAKGAPAPAPDWLLAQGQTK